MTSCLVLICFTPRAKKAAFLMLKDENACFQRQQQQVNQRLSFPFCPLKVFMSGLWSRTVADPHHPTEPRTSARPTPSHYVPKPPIEDRDKDLSDRKRMEKQQKRVTRENAGHRDLRRKKQCAQSGKHSVTLLPIQTTSGMLPQAHVGYVVSTADVCPTEISAEVSRGQGWCLLSAFVMPTVGECNR